MSKQITRFITLFLLCWIAKSGYGQVQASIGQGTTASNAIAYYIQSPSAVNGTLIQFHASFAIPTSAVTQPFTPSITLNSTGLATTALVTPIIASIDGVDHYIYTYVITGINSSFSLPANTPTKMLEVAFGGCTSGCATEVKAVSLDDNTYPQHYFYMNVGGTEVMNFDAPFFTNGSQTNAASNLDGSNCGSGYGCGSYVGFPSADLPLDLLGFEPRTDKCAVVLYWQTASEQNFGYYEIQASKDGRQFSPIGQQKPTSSNSSTLRMYQYEVPKAYQGYYFRLKMVDLDQTYQYSPIVATQVPCDKGYAVQVYPNPNYLSQLTVELSSAVDKEQVQWLLLDSFGKRLRQGKLDLKQGSNVWQVSTQDLPSGTYFIQVLGIEQLSSPLKFIKSNF